MKGGAEAGTAHQNSRQRDFEQAAEAAASTGCVRNWSSSLQNCGPSMRLSYFSHFSFLSLSLTHFAP